MDVLNCALSELPGYTGPYLTPGRSLGPAFFPIHCWPASTLSSPTPIPPQPSTFNRYFPSPPASNPQPIQLTSFRIIGAFKQEPLQEGETPECKVCMNYKSVMVLDQCGHLCLCCECAGKVDGICPLCRAQVRTYPLGLCYC